MDLSMELDMPASVLAHSMTEREFRRYHAYARRNYLPTRRLQVQLAQIALLLVKMMGDKDKTGDLELSDFLFDPPPLKAPTRERVVKEAREAFGFAPRKKRGKR